MTTTPANHSLQPRRIGMLLRVEVLLGFLVVVAIIWGALTVAFGKYLLHTSDVRTDLGMVDFAETTGTCTGCSAKSDSKSNVTWSCDFHFTVDGQMIKGTSYDSQLHFTGGSQVAIEYDPVNPESARIKGMRSGREQWWTWGFWAIFAAIGLLILVKAPGDVARNVRLLRTGTITTATFERLREKKREVEEEPDDKDDREAGKRREETIYIPIYRWTDSEGTNRTIQGAESSRPAHPESLQLIYDPRQPDTHERLSSIASNIQRGPGGEMIGGSIFVLVVKLLLIAGALTLAVLA